ncbi:MAG: BlaI/MecI/CopY family transcriptional regulator, partial [Bacteroidota bacterium]
QVLWDLGPAFLKEIMTNFPEPKPNQSTVSTLLRILRDKQFVDYEVFGKSHRYQALVSKESYAQEYFSHFLRGYFGGSFRQMLSFFHQKGELSIKDLDEVMKLANSDASESTPTSPEDPS